MAATKGGVEPASIENLITGEKVNFMFNPTQFTITKTNSWTSKAQMGVNAPRVEFGGGESATLALNGIYFDSQSEKKDVRLFTNPLFKMMLIDASTRDSDTNKGNPPPVAFSWGRVYFKAVITSITQEFTLFNENGTPLRAKLTINLKQYVDEQDQGNQVPGMKPNDQLEGTATYVEGQRIDNVLVKGKPNPRAVAEKNNIDNPLSIQAGASLKVK